MQQISNKIDGKIRGVRHIFSGKYKLEQSEYCCTSVCLWAVIEVYEIKGLQRTPSQFFVILHVTGG